MFRRWILPVLLILAAGVLGAWAISRRAAAPAPVRNPGEGGTRGAPPAPKPPEPDPPFLVMFGGELGGRLWIPPCSKFRQGGISRIGPVLRELTEKAPAFLLLDLGDMAGGPGQAGAGEMFAGLASLSESGLAVEAVGERDLLLGLDLWRQVKNEAGRDMVVLCANIRNAEDRPLAASFVRVPVGRKQILVMAILSPSFEKDLRDAGVPVKILDPVAVLRDTLKAAGKADFVILLSHAPAAESREILKAVAELDMVLTAHAGTLPWKEPEVVDGRLLLAGGEGWQFANAAALKDSGEGRKPELGEFVSRAVRWTTEPAMAHQVHADHALLKMRQPGFLESALRGAASRQSADSPSWTGPAACAACHAAAHEKWGGDPHSRSMARVREKRFDVAWNCLSCHATAPGRRGGHLAPGDAQEAVTCESCHGAGGAHVAADGRVPMESARESCARCHTPEMSPAFTFAEAWPRVVHGR